MTPGGPERRQTSPARVRAAEPADVAPASAVLAAAFHDYPWTRLTVDVDRRARRLRRLYALVLGKLTIPHGRVWIAETPGGDIVGAAGWLTPESDPPPALLAEVEEEVRALRGDRAAAAAAAEEVVHASAATAWPDERHWFLGTVGVSPGSAGSGIGSALLAAGLDAVDLDGTTARLETSLRRNVALYRRFGFAVSARVALPGGLPCWLMRRGPATVSAVDDHAT